MSNWVPQPYLGDLGPPWLFSPLVKTWDDPPSWNRINHQPWGSCNFAGFYEPCSKVFRRLVYFEANRTLRAEFQFVKSNSDIFVRTKKQYVSLFFSYIDINSKTNVLIPFTSK